MKKLLSIFCIAWLFSIPLYAADPYWIDDDGEADWVDCQDADPMSGTAACPYDEANSNADAGDTVYYRAGTYMIPVYNGINPSNSGSSGSPITFAAYNSEEVIIDGTNAGSAYGIRADSKSYIIIRGFTFQHWYATGYLNNSNHIEIDSNLFQYNNPPDSGGFYTNFYLRAGSSHNWIHDNVFRYIGYFTAVNDGLVQLDIGPDVPTEATGHNNYNTVEDNEFYGCGHHCLGVNGSDFSVIRNNYVHHESWYTGGDCALWNSGKCGYRVMSMTDGSNIDPNGDLIEGNYIAYGAQYGGPHLAAGMASGSGLTIGSDKNIVRYNALFGNALYAMRVGSSISRGSGSRIYNNTIYHSGYQWDVFGQTEPDPEDDDYANDDHRNGFKFNGSCPDLSDIVVKNNIADEIFSETNTHKTSTYFPAFDYGSGVSSCNTVVNNWGNAGSPQVGTPFTPFDDPLFTDDDITDPTALSLVGGVWTGSPDLSLSTTDSPCFDGGAYLTSTDGSSSTGACAPGPTCATLTVDDAGYFQDGSWGSELATNNADEIAIGTVTNTVAISSINYSTNVITLESAKSWDDNDEVWLYKNSSGTRVLYGSAPDYGAFEYVTGTPVQLNAPTLSSPANSATNQPLNVNLVWADTNTSPNEESYNMCIKESGGEYSCLEVAPGTTIAAASVLGGALSYSTTYVWKGNAVGDDVATLDSDDSSEWTFTTMDEPSGPSVGAGAVGMRTH